MVDIIDQRPAIMLRQVRFESTIEALRDEFPRDFGALAQQVLQRQLEGLQLLRNLSTSDLIASLKTFAYSCPDNLGPHQEGSPNSSSFKSAIRMRLRVSPLLSLNRPNRLYHL